MSTANRTAILTKTFKVLKKHYKPTVPPERSLFEHLLYACCLENARGETADEVFARLQQSYFDWNEVRVTTLGELSEVMGALPDGAAAATRLKRVLQGVFETHYAFDIEFFKKQNLGKSVKELEKLCAASPYMLAYVTQHALGGHAIPVNAGATRAFVALGVINESEMHEPHIPGIERAIPKNKGVEFASLLHQFGVEIEVAANAQRVRTILAEISPEAKDRLPKKPVKEDASQARKAKPLAEKPRPADKPAQAGPEKKVAEKKDAEKKDAEKKGAERKDTERRDAEKKAPEKKAAEKKSEPSAKSEDRTAKKPPREASAKQPESKRTSSKLAKKKPR